MSPTKLFESIVSKLKALPEEERWLSALKYYYAYFLTVDQIVEIASWPEIKDNIQAHTAKVVENLEWFTKYSGLVEYDAIMNSPRPFIWKLDALKTEFPEFITYFVNNDAFDFSNASKDGDCYNISWLEEYGLIEAVGLVFSRTIQPVVVDGKPSEPIVLAFPVITTTQLMEQEQEPIILPSLGGGAVLNGKFAPSHININFGDTLGISGVDTVMCFAELERFGIENEPYISARSQGHRLIG